MNAYDQMGERERTLIDSIIFERECLSQRYSNENKARSSSHTHKLAERFPRERESEARKLLTLRVALGEQRYQDELTCRYKYHTKNATALLRFGVCRDHHSDWKNGEWVVTRRDTSQIDLSIVVALLEYLPRPEEVTREASALVTRSSCRSYSR